MFALVPTILVALAGSTGFLLGCTAVRPHLSRLRAEIADAYWLAEHDPLTGLPNRAGAQRHFRLRAEAGRTPVAVLLDLDDFKRVNDTWGHQTGDALLCGIADRLTTACRPIDGFASRLAGDEFLLLLEVADPDSIMQDATTILNCLKAPMTLSARDTTTITATPSASAGIALPEPHSTWEDMLRRADTALYQAKSHPGDAVIQTPDNVPLGTAA